MDARKRPTEEEPLSERPLNVAELARLRGMDLAPRLIGALLGAVAAGLGLALIDGPAMDPTMLGGITIAVSAIALAAGAVGYKLRGVSRLIAKHGWVLEVQGPVLLSQANAETVVDVGGAQFRVAKNAAAKHFTTAEAKLAFVGGLPTKPLGGNDGLIFSINDATLRRPVPMKVQSYPAEVDASTPAPVKSVTATPSASFASATIAQPQALPPVPPTPTGPPCPTCANPVLWVPEYQRWYCLHCARYPWG